MLTPFQAFLINNYTQSPGGGETLFTRMMDFHIHHILPRHWCPHKGMSRLQKKDLNALLPLELQKWIYKQLKLCIRRKEEQFILGKRPSDKEWEDECRLTKYTPQTTKYGWSRCIFADRFWEMHFKTDLEVNSLWVTCHTLFTRVQVWVTIIFIRVAARIFEVTLLVKMTTDFSFHIWSGHIATTLTV